MAEKDAIKLARNMNLKYDVLGLPFGGFKAVVFSLDQLHREKCFERIGEWLDEYNGKFYIATDVGSSPIDMCSVYKRSKYVLDLPENVGGFGSFIPLLTEGVINGLKASVEKRYYSDDFSGISAYVLGLGSSGMAIAKRLCKLGCNVTGYDINENNNSIANSYGITISSNYFDDKYDIFVPCSYGNIFDKNEANLIRTKIIGGSANNPISDKVDKILTKRGIHVIPDFVISSGAIVLDDILIQQKEADLELGLERTKKIYDFVNRIYEKTKTDKTMKEVALEILGY